MPDSPTLHESTFEYLKPTDKQIESMATARKCFGALADYIEVALPNGADKTYVLRLIRTAAMWANVSITRHADGEPRR